jgi:hypothetical protein
METPMKSPSPDVHKSLTRFIQRYRDDSYRAADISLREIEDAFLRIKAQADEIEDMAFLDLRQKFEHLGMAMNQIGKTKSSHLREEFIRFRSQIEEKFPLDRALTPQFNIFSILRIAHLETKTHSPFLAELLDPRGTHEQGDLFLSSFLQLQPCGFALDQISTGNWEVRLEKYTAKGILDIVMSNYRTKHVVVIENKIYSGDQGDQLLRYLDWLENHSTFTERDKRRLIYLTPHGSQPSNPHIEARYCTCMSYKTDIRSWLENVLPRVESPRVSECVCQYLDIIKDL